MVFVDREARTVGVKLSTWPVPLEPGRHLDTLAAFHAITDHLTRRLPTSGHESTPDLTDPEEPR
jgi:hypothetical protein